MTIDPDSPWQDPNPPAPGGRNARTILAVSGVALVVVVIGALVGTVLRDKSLSQFDDTLVFQPRNVTTADPFTPDLAGVDVPISDQATQALDAGRETMTYDIDRGIRTVAGTTPGLYGGTGNNTSCNVDAAARFLAENPAKGAAWASVFGITTDQIPYYLNTLTPVVLASDTWVTDHSFRNGQAMPYQSVLQSGTAVMVDPAGVPRVHCSCGNPMSPPASRPIADYGTEGTRWAEYEPENVVAVAYGGATPVAESDSAVPGAVVPSPTVSEFQLLDLVTAEPLLRAVGQLVNLAAAVPLNAPLPDPVAMNVATQAESLVPIAAPVDAGELEPEAAQSSTSESSTTGSTTTTTTRQQPAAPSTERAATSVASPAPAVKTTLSTPQSAPPAPAVTSTSTTPPAPPPAASPATTPVTTTTTTLPPTPAEPPTRFSGPASGTVSSFALADGTSCQAAPPEPVIEEPEVPLQHNGSSATESAVPTTTRTSTRHAPTSIEFACSDGSTLSFSASQLSASAIDSALVDGVWKVRTDSGSVAVTSVTRTGR